MRFTWKDLIYIAAIVILGIFLLRGCGKPPHNTEVVKPRLTPTEQKTDKKGTSYTEIQGTLYTQAQMKHLTDSLRKVLGKGKIQTVIQTVTDIQVVHEHDTQYIDLATGDIYAADTNVNYAVSYRGNFKQRTGTFFLALTPDTATAVTAIKNPLFGRPVLTTNIYHSNLLFTPSMGTSYTTKVSRTIAVMGPLVAGGYGTESGKLQGFVGFGLTVPIISIRSKR